MNYAQGTCFTYHGPYGLTCHGRALCPDGKVRAFRGTHSDTFFSVPAKVSAGGTSVTGFIMMSTMDGYDTATDDDPAIVRFIPYKSGKNHALVEADSPPDES